MSKKTKKELKRRIKELEAKASDQALAISILRSHFASRKCVDPMTSPIGPSYDPWPYKPIPVWYGADQISDIKNNVLHTFGESTIEVNGVTVDEMPKNGPFARVPDKGQNHD